MKLIDEVFFTFCIPGLQNINIRLVIAGRRPQLKLFLIFRRRVERNDVDWQTELVLVVGHGRRVVYGHATKDQIVLVEEHVSGLGSITE